jgi:hypothetical protein
LYENDGFLIGGATDQKTMRTRAEGSESAADNAHKGTAVHEWQL